MSVAQNPKVVDVFEEGSWHRLGLPETPPIRDDWEPCFVRLGDAPPNGRSYNHHHGHWEAGIAVFKAFKTPEDEYIIDYQESTPLAIIHLRCQDRPAYRVYGTPCGRGVGQ